jgi:hypothetical protein
MRHVSVAPRTGIAAIAMRQVQFSATRHSAFWAIQGNDRVIRRKICRRPDFQRDVIREAVRTSVGEGCHV